jgi:hypothetical protein
MAPRLLEVIAEEIMKHTKPKLVLNRETVRQLVRRELSLANGGYPTQTQLASGCTVGSYGSCGEESECW